MHYFFFYFVSYCKMAMQMEYNMIKNITKKKIDSGEVFLFLYSPYKKGKGGCNWGKISLMVN